MESFLSKLSGSTDKPQDQNPENDKAPSSDLFSSAKQVADAAKSSFGGGGDGQQLEKGKVAGAAAHLLGAASDYGKLDETKGVGLYVNKAETYLNQYEKSHSSPHGSGAEPKAEEPPKKESSGDKEDGGSGVGDYLKVAEGFLKK